ncbi:PREDICTED: periodic tryptophan protein 2 homolog [Nicrophorus vespilloides]|uniref:Periodic tryptophan protein 2 homolog n=1 Tax=Nicrophorus vespilloides TaxID=110193 RepID=A0ABM1NFW7_NICVS|nr:PREDICTED: periodic tryptophan protein 2 homolog [Nicrophorus vespilloides]
MKFSYTFNNLLGCVYRQGNLIFTNDGNSVISPVGNRITIFDLKKNTSTTLPVESNYNFTTLALSPNGCTLLAVNENHATFMISLISNTVIHKRSFRHLVKAIKFSPDGKLFAMCLNDEVLIFQAPGPYSGEYNGFHLKRRLGGLADETICLDWSGDSKLLAVGTKEMLVHIYSMDNTKSNSRLTLGKQGSKVISVFFDHKTDDLITITAGSKLHVWKCIRQKDDVKSEEPMKKKKKEDEVEAEDYDATKTLEQTEEEITNALEKIDIIDEEEKSKKKKRKFDVSFQTTGHKILLDNGKVKICSATYHKENRILVVGTSVGDFYIYEMPECSLIHSLNISKNKIKSVAMNCTGDWIALGCTGIGQLLVWEWQSETYVMKQQGHSSNMSCISYSTDGQYIGTGGEDGKVKLWNTQTGYCFVTFSEHTSPVTSLQFCGNKKFLISASLDGTVRAFDIIRYRNFRTLTTPRPVQLSCVSVDSSGEFVAAGSQDSFEIYLWSMKLGRLLEILSGHGGPVCSIEFSPNPNSAVMASVSWDKTLRIWDAIEKGSAHETIELCSDGLAVAFHPAGQVVAVATLNGQISTFDVKSGSQLFTIDGRNDLGSGQLDTDLVSAKQSLKAKAFLTLCYSADGECILAGGQSKNVCIYNIKQGIILKKFSITCNLSLDGVQEFISWRNRTEFGNLKLVEEREELEGGKVAIRLPGVRKGDMAARNFKPEIRVFSVQFSPTGQQWTAATTEGLLIYSLNTGVVFDPWELQMNITPSSVRKAITDNDSTNALMMSMKLNEAGLINEVLESIPVKDIELTVSTLSEKYIERLLLIVSTALDSSTHLEFYLHWAQSILTTHGLTIKAQQNMPALLALQKSLSKKYEQFSKICDFNKYTMQYISRLGEVKASGDARMIEEDEASVDDINEEMDYSEEE